MIRTLPWSSPRRRRGSAAAELAVCLPMILLLVIGSIEISNMIHLDHSLTTASYEGVRKAIEHDATSTDVQNRCEQVIAARAISGATIALDPADVTSVPRGQTVTVTVSAPCAANSILPPWFFAGRTIEVPSTMVKE